MSNHVKHPRLRFALSFHPLFVGGNPFTTTSIYCLIAYLERRWGVHYAMGGTGSVVKGLVSLIEGQGNALRYGARVAAITLAGRRATGVRLAGGETDSRRHRGLQRRFGEHLPQPAAGLGAPPLDRPQDRPMHAIP